MRQRVGVYVMIAVLLGAFHAAMIFDLWHLVNVPRPVDALFIDMYVLLAAGECAMQGVDVFLENPCDYFGRPHVYPRTWLYLPQVGIGTEFSFGMGYAIGASFCVALAIWVAPRNLWEALPAPLVAWAPGVFMAAERGNFDLAAFTLVSTMAWLGALSGPGHAWSGVGLASLGASLKFYPLVAVGPWVWLHRRNKALAIAMAGAVGLATLVVGLAWREDWPKMAMHVPAPTARWYTMGAPLLFQQLGLELDHLARLLALGACLGAGWGGRRLEIPWRDVRSQIGVLLGATVLVFCFIARTNYDYRWVFLGLCLPTAFRAARLVQGATRWACAVFIVSSVFAMWNETVVLWIRDTGLFGRTFLEAMMNGGPVADHAASWIAVLGVAALGGSAFAALDRRADSEV